MENSKLLVYALTVVLFVLMLIYFPTNLSIGSIFEVDVISKLIYTLLFLSAYLALITVICVTEVNILEPIILVIVSFGLSVFIIGLQYSLAVLVVILYCLKVRRTNELLKVPNPSSSSAGSTSFLFTLLGVLVALIVFFTFVPKFEPESFSMMDPFAEMLFGCAPETSMIKCIQEKTMGESDYNSTVQQCHQLPPAQQQNCINQVDQQFQEAIKKSLQQYTQMGNVNATVGEFIREMAASQVNQMASDMGEQFKLLFAFATFSIISSLGGIIGFLVSILSSIFTFIFLKVGLITAEPREEKVIHYLLG